MREGKILIVYLGASDVLSRFSQIKYLILSTPLIVHQFAVDVFILRFGAVPQYISLFAIVRLTCASIQFKL